MTNDGANTEQMLANLPELAAIITKHLDQGDTEEVRLQLLTAIRPVIEAAFFGEDPTPAKFDREAIQRVAVPLRAITAEMTSGGNADLMRAGLMIIGTLDEPDGFEILRAKAESSIDWERYSAIDALALTTSDQGRALLLTLEKHADPETRIRAAKGLAAQALTKQDWDDRP